MSVLTNPVLTAPHPSLNVHGLQPGLVGNRVDRVDQVRSDPARAAAAFADPRARRLVIDRLDPVVDGNKLLTEALPDGAVIDDHVLLGVGEDGPIFAALGGDNPHGASYAPNVWAAAMDLADDQFALFGGARSLIDWHARHGFCANCDGSSFSVFK